MKLKRGWKDTNVFLSMRTAYLLFFCMLVIFGATQQGAHAQAYFPGGPSNWRPYGGYTNPDYSNKGPTPQIIAAGQVVSGAADGASFIGDQMYGVAQIISVIGTWWGYEILPNPTNSLPCNQAFDQSVRENGYWSATVSHLGTSIWNATPYKIGNAISIAAMDDLSPEIGGHQFTGQLAYLFGNMLPGAGLIGAVRPIAGIARPLRPSLPTAKPPLPKPGSGRLPLPIAPEPIPLPIVRPPGLLLPLIDDVRIPTTNPAKIRPSHPLEGNSSCKKIKQMMEQIRCGKDLHPVTVVEYGGQLWLLDGHHRCQAYRRCGKEVPYRVIQLEECELESLIKRCMECGPNRLNGLNHMR